MTIRVKAVYVVGLLFLILIKGVVEYRLDQIQRVPPSLDARIADYYGSNLRRFSFGYDNAIASSLWIDLLQRARHQHYGGMNSLSWEYLQIDAINCLDPLFERAYSYGGVVLSVLVQDKEGARRVLDRWVRRNSRSWQVHYLYGYHLFFELKNFKSASFHILRAAQLEGAPSWLNSLAVRLLSETGALAESLRLCLMLFDEVHDIEGRDRLSFRIRSLNFKLQQSAWQSGLEEFRAQYQREPESELELRPLVDIRFRDVASSITGAGVVKDLAVLLNERFPFSYDKKTHSISSGLKKGFIGPDEVGIYTIK